MPMACITFCDGRLHSLVDDTTSSRRNWAKAQRRQVHAASLAKPRPQWRRAKRQPISTAGAKGASKLTLSNPVMPMNAPLSLRSRAHKPKPYSLKCPRTRPINAAASTRVSGAGK
ncbi:hypothetical protein D9M73_187980 [compost metagenome]